VKYQKPQVTIYYDLDRAHHSQIYTGFRRLHRLGFITLRQRPWRDCPLAEGLQQVKPPIVVSIDGALAGYDLQDGRGLVSGCLDGVSAYFKRGYDARAIDRLPRAQRHKIRPLGLNYRVWDDAADPFGMTRAIRTYGIRGLPAFFRSLGVNLRFVPRLSALEHPPPFGAAPRVLFMTRLWDTGKVRRFEGIRSHAEVDAMRIACVRALKQEFGAAFVGGIAPGPLAARCDPDLVVDPRMVDKRNYLKLMKDTPICVTTAGLFDSNGGKLGEYVACSRAIVCEPLVHTVPGGFAAGQNYLEFTTPESCVAQVGRLMNDRVLRERMMLRNFHYYQSFLKPEWLVLNTIAQVFEITGERPAVREREAPVG
jgi:hypothetical protein